MDHTAAAEEKIVSKRRRQLNEVTLAAQSQLSDIKDHVKSLKQAYYRCAHECSKSRRKSEEISNCVEHCSVPINRAQNFVNYEMDKFKERLRRSLKVCKDKFETAKSQQMRGGNAAINNEIELCVDEAIQDTISTFPHITGRLKAALSVNN